MKKIILSTLLLSTTALVALPNITLATTDGDITTIDTPEKPKMSISFDGKNINIGEGPFADNLSFTKVPADFGFGTQKSESGTTVEFPFVSSDNGKQWVVVNDDRPVDSEGAGNNWVVKVGMDALTNVIDEKDTLDANLILQLGDVKEYHLGKTVDPNSPTGDFLPNDPNKPGSVTEWKSGEAPTDILLGTETIPLKGAMVTIPTTGAGNAVEVMKQSKKRTGAEIKKQGYASNIVSAKVQFPTLTETKVQNNTYESVMTWTLDRTGF